jgi:arylsulfatase A-like enzyme
MTDSSRLTRRSFVAGAPAAVFAQKRDNPPNVLLIMADDLGQECLGCYGGTSYRTPNLDRMAATGVKFTHAYAQPLCTPTRVQLMTGQHNFRNWRGFGIMDPNDKTFGHMMQRAGYATTIAGKWQFYSYEGQGSPRRGAGMLPEQGGFEDYLLWHDRYTESKGSRFADPVVNQNGKLRTDTKGKYGPDLFAEHIENFLERDRERPFFAYYPMVLTHGPFNPTPRSAVWASGDRLKDDSKYYGDMVSYMDDIVGRILGKIDKLGLASRTLVLYYSDNGTPREIKSVANGRTIPGGKGLTTDNGMRVPLIARWQGVTQAGRECNHLVDSTDFIPTICEATGAKWFEGRPLDGRSFVPQLRGHRGNPREWLFSHYDPHPGCKVNFKPTRFTWDHRWKLYMDGRLFDRKNDPFEEVPVPKESQSAEARSARSRLQAGLDKMAGIKAPKFNKFETDGRPAY